MKYVSGIIIFLILGYTSGCAYLPIQDQHTLKKGETVERVARHYEVGAKKLAKHNGWADIDHLFPEDSTHVKLTEPRYSHRVLKKAAYTMPATRFMWPVHGRISSKFGRRWGTMHNGIDISSSFGTPIKSASSGTVIYSGTEPGYGKLVIIYHGRGYSTVYAHASKLKMRKGQQVKRGQTIAWVGSTGRSTGPHLHFEIRKHQDAQNPIYYLP